MGIKDFFQRGGGLKPSRPDREDDDIDFGKHELDRPSPDGGREEDTLRDRDRPPPQRP